MRQRRILSNEVCRTARGLKDCQQPAPGVDGSADKVQPLGAVGPNVRAQWAKLCPAVGQIKDCAQMDLVVIAPGLSRVADLTLDVSFNPFVAQEMHPLDDEIAERSLFGWPIHAVVCIRDRNEHKQRAVPIWRI